MFLELDIGMPCYVGGLHQTYTIVQTAMGYCNIAILLVLPFTSSMLLRNRSISSTPNQLLDTMVGYHCYLGRGV